MSDALRVDSDIDASIGSHLQASSSQTGNDRATEVTGVSSPA